MSASFLMNYELDFDTWLSNSMMQYVADAGFDGVNRGYNTDELWVYDGSAR